MPICEDFEYITESFNKDSKHIWMVLIHCPSREACHYTATGLGWESGNSSKIYPTYKRGDYKDA
jgi:hypothetical protein